VTDNRFFFVPVLLEKRLHLISKFFPDII